MVSQSPRIVASGPQLVHRVVAIKEDLGRLVGTLDETLVIWRKYLQQLPETESLPAALDELQSAFSSSQEVFCRMVEVATTVKRLHVPILLEGESIHSTPIEVC